MCRRNARMLPLRTLAPNRTSPESAFTRWRIARPNVVFPLPDSPTRPSVSPRNMSRETPSTARTGPNLTFRSRTEIRGSGILPHPTKREMIRADGVVGRTLPAAAVDGFGAPGRERTLVGPQSREIGRYAGDGRQFLA